MVVIIGPRYTLYIYIYIRDMSLLFLSVGLYFIRFVKSRDPMGFILMG